MAFQISVAQKKRGNDNFHVVYLTINISGMGVNVVMATIPNSICCCSMIRNFLCSQLIRDAIRDCGDSELISSVHFFDTLIYLRIRFAQK